MLQAVIIAGGLATRLRPLTEKIPKSLIEINGEPFIFHQLRLLKKQGITRILICLGYLGEQVVETIKNQMPIDPSLLEDLEIKYSFDGSELLGTAGCLRKALSLLEETFFVLYGDSYLPCDYEEIEDFFFAQKDRSKKPALMTVFLNEGRWDSSNVEFQTGQIIRYSKVDRDEKMQYIDYGLGIFNRAVIETLPLGNLDLATVYQDLLHENNLAAVEVNQRFYEIGSLAGIEAFSGYLNSFF
jgi:NDP-sugar pyrophosphorylase family protein